jgi:hypothetical protein
MNRLSEVFRSNLVDLLALPLALGLSVTALIVGLQREHWNAEDGARESAVAIQDRVERGYPAERGLAEADVPGDPGPTTSLAQIQDRAAAAGYDFVPCQESDERNCLGDIFTAPGEDTLYIRLYGRGAKGAVARPEGSYQRYGVFRPGYVILRVSAVPTRDLLRAYLTAVQASAKWQEAIPQGSAAYVVIGDHWWGASPDKSDERINQEKFVDVVGKMEGCAPDCQIRESSFDR